MSYRWEICVFSTRLLLQVIFRNVSSNDFIIFNTQEESKEQSFSYAFIFPIYCLFSTSLNTSVFQAYSSKNLSYVTELQIPHITFSLFSQIKVKTKYFVIHNHLVRGLIFLFYFYCSKNVLKEFSFNWVWKPSTFNENSLTPNCHLPPSVSLIRLLHFFFVLWTAPLLLLQFILQVNS